MSFQPEEETVLPNGVRHVRRYRPSVIPVVPGHVPNPMVTGPMALIPPRMIYTSEPLPPYALYPGRLYG